MSNPFDGNRNPTPVPPPPRDASDSGGWHAAHRALEERLGEVRDGAIVAHGIDGRNGRLSAVEKRIDGSRALLIALLCASLGGLGTAATGWLSMRDRVTRSEAQLEVWRPLVEAFARHLSAPVTPAPYTSGGIP